MKKEIILAQLILLFISFKTYAQQTNDSISVEDKFVIMPAASIYLDAARYFEDKEPLSSGGALGDIRFGMKGTLGKQWKGEMTFGFANSSIQFKDIYIQYSFKKRASNIQLGHFAEPFGLEYIEGSLFNRFITTAAASQVFGSKRHLGIQYTGWNNFLWYAGGLFADDNVAKGANVGSQGYGLTGRIVFNPLRSNGKLFHLGIAGSYRKANSAGLTTDENNNTIEAPRSMNYKANAVSVVESRNFINVIVDNAKSLQKIAAELILSSGRFYAQGEYFRTHINRSLSDLSSYNCYGMYGQLGFLAIGDRAYTYDVSQARMIGCRPGTLELLARFGLTDLNDSKASLMGGKQTDITLSANYYFKKYMQIRASYSNVSLDEHSLIGKQKFNSISLRVMILFD